MSPSIIFEDFVSAYFVYHTQAICFNFRIGQITNALYEVDGHTVDEIDFDLLEYIKLKVSKNIYLIYIINSYTTSYVYIKWLK